MTATKGAASRQESRVGAFPTELYGSAGRYCSAYLGDLARAAGSIAMVDVERAAAVLLHAYRSGATVFSCGNGGSAAIANHLQCDHLKGIRSGTDLKPHVLSLSSSIELVTAVANDIAYEEVFAYQLQSQSLPGDVLVAISSSGRSPNVVRALTWARDHHIRTIALTGFDGGDARRLADVAIHVSSGNYGIVEDLHQTVMHAIAQYLRQSRMPADAIPVTSF